MRPQGYPSEKLRVDRLQVNYLKQKTQSASSNEVVRYKPGGAKQAMREVGLHALSCPHTPVVTGEKASARFGSRSRGSRTRISLRATSPCACAPSASSTDGTHVDETSYAVYQRVGDVLSGVYSFGPNTPAQKHSSFTRRR